MHAQAMDDAKSALNRVDVSGRFKWLKKFWRAKSRLKRLTDATVNLEKARHHFVQSLVAQGVLRTDTTSRLQRTYNTQCAVSVAWGYSMGPISCCDGQQHIWYIWQVWHWLEHRC